MGFTIKFDTSPIDRMLDQFEGNIQEALRPAAQAGAQVLYDAVKRNVANINSVTGNLSSSIYQVYSDQSRPNKAVYHISWNARKAPHGHLVEYGYIQKYRVIVDKNGNFKTLKSKPLPEPKYIPGKAFVRSAAMWSDQALVAAEQKLFDMVTGPYTIQYKGLK
jgi:hypothetical protein